MLHTLLKFVSYQSKIHVSALTLFLPFFLFLGLNSCKKDSVKDCDRTCYLGTWIVKQDCGTGSYTFEATIIAVGSDASKVSIEGFNDTYEIDAQVNGETLTFSNQSTPPYTYVTGIATLSSDKKIMNMNYTLADQVGPTGSCQGTWTKK